MSETSDFVIPRPERPRDRWRARMDVETAGWPQGTVVVEERVSTDASSSTWETRWTYKRNYAFYRTFEAFRQLQNGEWHEYALISQSYTRLDVMDLETGEVIATEQPSEKAIEHARWFLDKYKDNEHYKDTTPEQFARGNGFCPTEFYVPDFWDPWTEDKAGAKATTVEDIEEMRTESWWKPEKDEQRYTGQWGVYSGCMWGDDWSWKLQYVDLSRISEGVVTTDDRFGYVPLPNRRGRLRDFVAYDEEMDFVTVQVEVQFRREEGTVRQDTLEGINGITLVGDEKETE